jgi:hypothetical protein
MDGPTDSRNRHGDPGPQAHRWLLGASLGLQYLEVTDTHFVLATRPVKLVSACLSPTRPLMESDMTECLSWEIPVLMACDFNGKHTDWNSRLITARGSLLCDYADGNSCLTYGRIPQPRLLTRTTPLTTFLIQLLSTTSSNPCIWLFCTQLVS